MTAVTENVVNNFVALDNQQYNIVLSDNPYSAVVLSQDGLVVSINNPSNLLQQVNSLGSILAGPLMLQSASTESTMYTTRIDFISDNELYKGEAVPGTAEAATAWRISKTLIAGDGDVTTTWASGTAEFNKAWSARVSYSYS